MKVMRILPVIIVLGILLAAGTMASAATVGDKWYFGGENGTDQSAPTQGTDGWHYMYFVETAQGDDFNVSDIKECVSGDTAWKNPPNNVTPLYIPAETLNQYGVEKDWSGLWWIIYSPWNMLQSDGDFGAALKWVAPETGSYKIIGQFWGSSETAALYGVNDGMQFSVYKNTERLHTNSYTGAGPLTDDYELTVDLAEGDAIYFIADPNASSWDLSKCQAEIELLSVSSTQSIDETSQAASDDVQTGDAGTAASIAAILTAGAAWIAASRRRAK